MQYTHATATSLRLNKGIVLRNDQTPAGDSSTGAYQQYSHLADAPEAVPMTNSLPFQLFSMEVRQC